MLVHSLRKLAYGFTERFLFVFIWPMPFHLLKVLHKETYALALPSNKVAVSITHLDGIVIERRPELVFLLFFCMLHVSNFGRVLRKLKLHTDTRLSDATLRSTSEHRALRLFGPPFATLDPLACPTPSGLVRCYTNRLALAVPQKEDAFEIGVECLSVMGERDDSDDGRCRGCG